MSERRELPESYLERAVRLAEQAEGLIYQSPEQAAAIAAVASAYALIDHSHRMTDIEIAICELDTVVRMANGLEVPEHD
jgi:hypothetical protein